MRMIVGFRPDHHVTIRAINAANQMPGIEIRMQRIGDTASMNSVLGMDADRIEFWFDTDLRCSQFVRDLMTAMAMAQGRRAGMKEEEAQEPAGVLA